MPPLLKLILIRLGLGVLTLWLVSLVVFVATQALPGDPARAILGRASANKELYLALRQQLQLDRPLYDQYSSWLGGVIQGDFGDSLSQPGTPVADLLGECVVNSAALVLFAALISIPLSILLGALSALWRDSKFDVAASIGSLSLAALPEFVVGILLVLLLSIAVFHWMPSISDVNPEIAISSQLQLFVLPTIALSLAVIPYVSRLLRASMIEVLESEYVMMAHLKGLSGKLVLWRHALPNGVAPAIQGIAISLAWLAGGIVTVEYVFGFPGVGSLLVKAVNNRDMPMVQAICLIIAGVYVLANLSADIITILVNPRLRTGLR